MYHAYIKTWSITITLTILTILQGCASVGYTGVISVHEGLRENTQTIAASSCDPHRHQLGTLQTGSKGIINIAGEQFRIDVHDPFRETLLFTGPYIPIFPVFLVIPFIESKPISTKLELIKLNVSKNSGGFSDFYIIDNLDDTVVRPASVEGDAQSGRIILKFVGLGKGALRYDLFLISSSNSEKYKIPLGYDSAFWFCWGVH